MGFFDVSLDTANEFYSWGWRASVAGALLTSFGVGFLFWGTRIRDRDFEIQVSTLNSEAGAARERASKLGERAAGLEKQAADARLETERLKSMVVWRQIDRSSAQTLKEELSASPSKVTILYTMSDPEASALAIQIAKIFQSAQWKIAMAALSINGRLFFDLGVSTEPEATIIHNAFKTANVKVFDASVPWSDALTIGSIFAGSPTIVVGSRRPVDLN